MFVPMRAYLLFFLVLGLDVMCFSEETRGRVIVIVVDDHWQVLVECGDICFC